MDEKKFKRDQAGGFKIPSTKPGSIKIMCSLKDHLEIYTPHETFKLQTPETIDPERTNPDAMWVNAKTHDVGSSSPFVARTLIMASEMLRKNHRDQSEALLMRMHTIKELLLQCSSASKTYLDAFELESKELEASGYKTTANGQALVKFPVLPDLEAKCTAFLIAARRTIAETCQIPAHFWTLKRTHTSVEHLINNELLSLLGKDHRLVTHLQTYISPTKRLINLRNGQEHATTTKSPPLHVRNFETMPTNQIRSPVWFLEGEEPEDIASTIQAVPDFLLHFVETMFIGCMDATLTKWPPMYFEMIDPIDPECPIRYRLEIDVGQLNLSK